jgi:hypothetical protein
MAGNEFNFFQIPNGVSGGMGIDNQHRPFGMRMSNYGDLAKGEKNTYGFKDEIANPQPKDAGKSIIDNPFVDGSTVKYVRDDKFVRMSMGDISIVSKDVNSRVKADADADYYMPAEGWRPFGALD